MLPVVDHLMDPLKWGTPRKVFVNSVSDLFYDNVQTGYIRAVADVMVAANWHAYQVLTKRSRRMAELLQSEIRFAAEQPHIMWGVTVENRSTLSRIHDLRGTPAKMRYVSFEPLLEDLGEVNLSGIHWIIVGGESGRDARPFRKEWIESLGDQAAAAGVAFFFKQ